MKELTPRDEKLLRQLGDFGVLSTAQLRATFFAETRKTTMLRRLRKLEKLALIRRLRGLPDGSHGWCLTLRCATALGFVGIGNRINRHTLEHDITLSQIRLVLQTVGLGAQWTPEHVLQHKAWQARKPHSAAPDNIPDGVFIVPYNGSFIAVAIELELTTKNKERYRKTLRAYWWKRNIGMIWYLVPHEALGQKLDRVWKKVIEGGKDRHLRWSIIDELLNNPYDVRLHNQDGSVPLREVFAIKPPPAHGVAHPVSRPTAENPSSSK
jgi:hypothetical protein